MTAGSRLELRPLLFVAVLVVAAATLSVVLPAMAVANALAAASFGWGISIRRYASLASTDDLTSSSAAPTEVAKATAGVDGDLITAESILARAVTHAAMLDEEPDEFDARMERLERFRRMPPRNYL